ncbi:MAG: nitroreductase family protein [Bacillota bacterium]
MDFEKVVNDRRSVRRFENRMVEEEKINKLIEAARLCQSAKNRQPWKFMVLQGNEKDKIAEIMLALFERKNIDLPGYVNSSKSSADAIKKAPLLILVFKEKDKDKDDNWTTGDLLSIGAAIEHICLEAVNLNLGSVWIRDTVYTEQEICDYAGYSKLQLVSGIAVGYPAEEPAARPRKKAEEIILQKR